MSQRGGARKHNSSGGIGPGGLNCPCCAPKRGNARKHILRAIRRLEKEAAMKVEEADVRSPISREYL